MDVERINIFNAYKFASQQLSLRAEQSNPERR